MIDEKLLDDVIRSMIRDGHIMESGDYVFEDNTYSYRIMRKSK